MSRRIAIYGGTFDPPHEGHLKVADHIQACFDMERLLLVPAVVPPHKRGQTISSPFHRMAMLALATSDRPRIEISTIELEVPSRPYTIETLGKLQQIYPDARLFFVMGADSFRDVTSWREYRRILTEYDLIVAARPGYLAGEATVEEMAGHLPPEIAQSVIDLRGGRLPTGEDLARRHIYLTDYVAIDIAATALRQTAAEGRSLAGLVPGPVADYIAKYQLYRNLL